MRKNIPTGPDFLRMSMASRLSSNCSSIWRGVTRGGRAAAADGPPPALREPAAPFLDDATAPTKLLPPMRPREPLQERRALLRAQIQSRLRRLLVAVPILPPGQH